MSASESEIVARSAATDTVEALRDTLSDVLAGLVAAGCGPHHLTGMEWEAADPAAFHISRHAVELAYREVFVGFRPPIRLRPSAGQGLTIRARFAPPQPLPDIEVEGYPLRELARQYSPRLQADMKVLLRQWSRDGAAFRAGHAGLDLAYGPDRFEQLDLYRPAGAQRVPVWVFVHGGYWQATDKIQHAQFAQGLLNAGFAVAMPNYGLAPDTPLEASIVQTVAALNFLIREADALGLDPAQLHISGHSAGGHLAAMALCDPAAPPVASALLLSGLYDLKPLGHLPIGRLLGFDDVERAVRLSPLGRSRPSNTRLAFAVGEGESEAFKRQSAVLAAAWHAPEPLICPGHHFSMLDGLNGGALLNLALATAGK
ncbi:MULTISPECIES: alpha/beta hydrolase [unclassified Bosea (in: a-proteobacteria)]|uniref:alpha/beta hydrolase n=1 Tax=unclassified Bosea (in: a-proteobacteria) TaxID=2653178 RepID=UPI0013E0A082|nr:MULTISPECIES: alpha/beta hydrolase [unclassified Bosea (in: a-proteobacteria)]